MLELQDNVLFKNRLGVEEHAPTMNYKCSIYPQFDLGWKIKKWFSVDTDKLQSWYSELEDKFISHKFICQETQIPENNWCGFYPPGTGYYNITSEMTFGYLKEIKDSLPFTATDHWTVVTHTPGTRLGMHQDEPEWLMLHVPIYTNDKATWIIGGEGGFFMPPGNAHILNSTIPHDVVNYGSTDRVHLYFSIPTNELDRLHVLSQI